jgi:hypothetical protein
MEKIKKLLEFTENESTNLPEVMGFSKGSAKGKVYSYECVYYKQKDLTYKT